MRIQFADCVFDPLTRQVVRDGEVLELTPKAFELLAALLLARPRALSRAELRDRLWPATYVSYSALSRVVNEVRGAIGDDAGDPRLIRTVRGFGYAFSGEASGRAAATEPGGHPRCRLVWGGRVIWLAEGEHLIGRAHDCQVRIDSPRISRRHARIRVGPEAAVLEDLGSKNGTYVGSRRVDGTVRLADGDELCVGSALLRFRMGDEPDSTETGGRP